MDALKIERLQISADVQLEVAAHSGAIEIRLLRRTALGTFDPTAAGLRCPALFVPHLTDLLRELAMVASLPAEPGGEHA